MGSVQERPSYERVDVAAFNDRGGLFFFLEDILFAWVQQREISDHSLKVGEMFRLYSYLVVPAVQ